MKVDNMSVQSRFREMLLSPSLEFIMEAHNGLSAKVAEEAGFKGIWASGLSISAALGVRDNNEASWTQVLDVLEFMSDAVDLPIMLDGDTGYGNFNNMRRLVRKLEQRRIAAVCIEDKLFPKSNSFIGEGQPLADIDEFCGKIKAGKDSQIDDDFSIVARVEALIAGWGMDEALRRAGAYHEAGADAILMHSKKSTPDEILGFMKEWGGRCPVVIVPTMYYATPTDVFRDADVSMIIWANHSMRAALGAMRDITQRIFEEQSLITVEASLPTVKDVFALQGNAELAAAEARYLPTSGGKHTAVILAAGHGSELGFFTEGRPKAMVDIRGKPLLRRMIDAFKDGGVRDIAVVRGYAKSAIDFSDITTYDNDEFDHNSEVASLACADDALGGDVVISYGDILFRPLVLDMLLRDDGDVTLVVDASYKERADRSQDRHVDTVVCSEPYRTTYSGEDAAVQLAAVGDGAGDVSGEWIGLAKLSPTGSKLVRNAMDRMHDAGTLHTARLTDLWQQLLDDGAKISVVYVAGHWLDVDDVADLAQARDFM